MKSFLWNIPQPRLLSLRVSLGLILSIHLLAAVLLVRLEANNSPEVYVPHDAPAAQLERSLRAEFPNDENLIALFDGPDVYSETFLSALHRVVQRLEQHPLVDRVFSVTTIDHIAGSVDGFTVEKLIDPERLAELTPSERQTRILSDRFAPGILATKDGSALAIVVRPKKLEKSSQRAAVESVFHDAIRAERLEHYLIAVAGPVPLDAAELQSMLQDGARFTPLVVALGLLLLYWVVGRLVPVLVGAVAMSTVVVSGVALVAALNQPYTLVTVMVPTLLAAYTVANLLHLYAALLRLRNSREDHQTRILRALREVHNPTFYNVLSTMAGMISLTLISIPPIRIFGLASAFGVALIYLVQFYLLPPLLLKWDRKPWPASGSGFSWTRRISHGLSTYSMRHAGWIVAVLFLSTLLAAPQVGKVVSETDLLKFFDDEHPLTRATNLIEKRLLGVTTLEIVVDASVRDAFKKVDTLKQLKMVQVWSKSLPEVDHTTSMMDIVEEMNWAFHNEDPAYRALPDNDKMLSQLLLIYDGKDLNDVVNREYQRTRILLNLNVHGANSIQAVIEKINAHLAQVESPGLRWQIGGYGRLFSDQEDLLVIGQERSFVGAFGQIFLMMLLLWRSLPAAIIGMLPNLAPLFFVFVLMGSAGIYLDMATVLIAGVVLGITVDDTIHFFHNYLERRKAGCSAVFALARSFDTSGRAVVAISLLLVVQFMLLATSHFQPTAHFGLLASTGLLAGQILELLLLPALIVLWSRLGTKPRWTRL